MLALGAELTVDARGEIGFALIQAEAQGGDFGAEIKGENAELPDGEFAAGDFDASAQGEFEARRGGVDAAAHGGHPGAKIEGYDAQVRGSEAFAGLFEAGAESAGQAGGEFVGALALLAQEIERAAEPATASQFVDAAGGFEQAVTHQAGEIVAQVGEVLVEFAAGLQDEFGGGGRGGGAHIGDEIGDGEIGFVADAGDYRDCGIEDGARDDLFVEGPQIFEGAAAPRQNQHVDRDFLIEVFQSFDDFGGGAFALYAYGIERQADIVEAAAQNADDVADGGAAGGSDQADAAGK